MITAHSLVTRHSSLVTAMALAAAIAAAGDAPSPYGVCAHLQRHGDSAWRNAECAAIAAAGISHVRFDLDWWRVQPRPDAPFDFSYYDPIVADCERHGLVPLPILFSPPGWAKPASEHLEAYGRFVEAVVAHFGEHLPEIEIWNEQNLPVFWGKAPDPKEYTALLRVAYEAARRANASASGHLSGEAALRPQSGHLSGEAALRPQSGHLSSEAALNGGTAAPSPRVLFGGTAGVALDFIRPVYEAGGKDFFDAMVIHPYSHPFAPDGRLEKVIASLRALMAEFGDADKPIIFSEHGWPTHNASIKGASLMLAGLKIARPEQKTWRTVYAANNPGPDGGPPRDLAETITEALPPGSTCEACFGARLRERLAAGDVDAVIYPFDESFPADTFDAVEAFVKAGGVLVDLGGMPMYYRIVEKAPGIFVSEGQDDEKCLRRKLRIDAVGPWMDEAITHQPNQSVRAFPTEAAKAAGFKGDPAGEWVGRYQSPSLLRPGDEFIPLLTIKDANGKDVAAASVTRLAGGKEGCLIISGSLGGAGASAGETAQARYLVRSLAISMAEGIDGYYWYEFRAEENDPFYSEHHFGLTHANFTPKPAWGAYKNFTLARPAGSVQTPGPWRDAKSALYYPQWTRPDGVKAGVIWKPGATERRALRFDGADIRFRNYTGRTMKPVKTADGAYLVPIGENPVYFEGGALAPPGGGADRR